VAPLARLTCHQSPAGVLPTRVTLSSGLSVATAEKSVPGPLRTLISPVADALRAATAWRRRSVAVGVGKSPHGARALAS
jgi:hypothetical protein